MRNIGEEIAGEYLKWCRGCDFITYNVNTQDAQGEIDVVAIHLKREKIYVCEVAVHLETGLHYVKNHRPDNVDRFVKKFSKDIEYVQKYFSKFEIIAMLWSPIVKDQKVGSKYNQLNDVRKIQKIIINRYGITLDLVINEKYLSYPDDLREKAKQDTAEIKSPVMRLMQINGKLKKFLNVEPK